MAQLEEMPLFPLHSVLFPYARIQLHVFEPRYREMIRHCVEFDQPFGIVLIRSGSEVGDIAEPYMVGTAVRVIHVHTYDDGRMDVRVQGERRFRVRRLDDSNAYLLGYVEPVVEMEVEDNPRTDALTMRAQEDFKMLIEGTFARPDFNIEVRLSSDPTQLSFVIANFLNLDNREKQRLLEMTDTTERLAELIPMIENQIVEANVPKYYRLTSAHLQEWMSSN